MISSNLIRSCGLAAMLGGALWPLWHVGGYFFWGNYETYETHNRLMSVVLLLLLAGLLGFHAAQRERHGRWGGIGFVLSFAGLALMIVGNAAEFWLFTTQPYAELNGRQTSWAVFLLGVLTLAAGSAVFGFATLKAGMLPRPGAALLMVWIPAGALSGVLAGATGLLPADLALSLVMAATLGAGWVLLGFALWSKDVPVYRSTQAPKRVAHEGEE